MNARVALAVLAAGLSLAQLAAAAATEQKFGNMPESFEIKYYLQPRYGYVVSGDRADENSFRVRRSRFALTSTVAPNIKGRLEVSAVSEKVEMLQANLQWTPWLVEYPAVSFMAGAFKKPFSYQEFALSSSDLNLVERSYSHEFLEKKLFASSYDVGAMGTLDLWEMDVPVLLNLGVFNGNGLGGKADANPGKQVVARAEATPLTGVTVGGNLALNRLDAFEVAGADTAKTGQTFGVWGGDVLLSRGRWQALGEVFGGDNYEKVVTLAGARKSPGFEAPAFLGAYAELIYRTADGWEPAVRAERFDPDTDGEDDARLLLTGQVARTFSPNFRWQINWVHTRFEEDGAEAEDEILSQWTVKL